MVMSVATLCNCGLTPGGSSPPQVSWGSCSRRAPTGHCQITFLVIEVQWPVDHCLDQLYWFLTLGLLLSTLLVTSFSPSCWSSHPWQVLTVPLPAPGFVIAWLWDNFQPHSACIHRANPVPQPALSSFQTLQHTPFEGWFTQCHSVSLWSLPGESSSEFLIFVVRMTRDSSL